MYLCGDFPNRDRLAGSGRQSGFIRDNVLRQQLVTLHTWSGLLVGLVLAFLALTAAGFVLRPVFEHSLYGHFLTVAACRQRLSLDRLAADARAVHPVGSLQALHVPSEASASVAVRFSDDDLVYLEPCTGEILGTQNVYGGFFGFFDGLHRFRFLQDGRQVAGTCNAVFLALLLLGGLILWWPRAGQSLKAAATFNPRLPGTARTISLHKVIGLYTLCVLLIISLTALPLSFQPVRDFISWLTRSPTTIPSPPHSTPRPGSQRIPMQAAWERARRAFPDAAWVDIAYPSAPKDSIVMELLQRGAPHSEAKSYLYLDAYSGAVLRRAPYATRTPMGRKVYLYLLALHSGLVGGLPAQLLLLAACLGVPVQVYSGFSPYLRRKLRKSATRAYPVRIARKLREATDICAFELVHPKGAPLPSFSAGSHISVHIRPGLIRQYSLCNDPRETHRYLIAVLHVERSRGGSRAMHELREGMRVHIGLPRNHFPLVRDARQSVLLAGGIGVTPILSMAEELSRAGADFEMHYCTRSAERTAFLRRIQSSPYAQRVRLHFDDGPAAARLSLPAILAQPDPGKHLYVCGPKGFMEATLQAAREHGWSEAHVHREYFSARPQPADQNVAFDIQLARTGRRIRVEREQSALEALQSAGIHMQSSCAEGVCGTCLTRVLAGTPDHRDLFLTADERARNDRFLPCCSRSAGGILVLDL
jgi:ferredoxin-NADP reductase